MSAWMTVQWLMLALVLPFAGYFFRGWRQGRVQAAYCIILIFGYVWALWQHLISCIYLYRPQENIYRAAIYLCYLGMCALGPACVYLSWRYAGKFRLYRDPAKVAALFGAGVFFYAAVLTNDLHNLYYTYFSITGRGYGPLFYLFTVFSYVCFVWAYVTMRRVKWDAENRSTLLFLLCFLPPVAANTWGMLVENPALDFTPLAYCVMVLGGYLISWQHRPLVLAPVAAKNILDNMGHPVLVKSLDGEILYRGGGPESGECAYRDTETVLSGGNTLVMRTDVSTYKKLQDELDAQRLELEAARERLSEQSKRLSRQSETAAELAASQQRMKIMALLDREVRGVLEDMLSHTQAALSLPEREKISEGFEKSSEALELVRQIVREVKGGAGDGI